MNLQTFFNNNNMKTTKIAFIAFSVLSTQFSVLHAQADLFDHPFWMASGQLRQNAGYAEAGLSDLGKINDSIPHAIGIAQNYFFDAGASGTVFTALAPCSYPLDTAELYEFPGNHVQAVLPERRCVPRLRVLERLFRRRDRASRHAEN